MSVELVVSGDDLVQFMERAAKAVAEVPQALMDTLRENLVQESFPASERVAASWVDVGPPEAGRIVSDIFWASFLARGTRPHGPVRAKALRFVVHGSVVFAERVAGLVPNPFDVRAVADTYAEAPAVLDETLAAAGVL